MLSVRIRDEARCTISQKILPSAVDTKPRAQSVYLSGASSANPDIDANESKHDFEESKMYLSVDMALSGIALAVQRWVGSAAAPLSGAGVNSKQQERTRTAATPIAKTPIANMSKSVSQRTHWNQPIGGRLQNLAT